MAIWIAPDSAEGIERAKWEQHQGPLGAPGNPYVFREYPKAMHKAGRPTHGNVLITESVTAHTSDQEAVLKGQGWHANPQDAVNAVHAEHLEQGKLAAERHHVERTMSEPAQREANAIDAATVYHVPAIPESPRKPRGRPARTPAGV